MDNAKTKTDMFDLDVKVSKSGGAETRVTSVVACTPGTCWPTCKGNATYHSNCCDVGKTSLFC